MSRLFAVAAASLGASACSGETMVPPPTHRVTTLEWQPIGSVAPSNITFTPSAKVPASLPDYRAPGNPVIRLDLLPGRVSLPIVAPPEGLAELSDNVVLDHREMANPKNAPRKLKVLGAPLPFTLDVEDPSFRPEGMSVAVDGKTVPFGRGSAPKAETPSWRVSPNGKQIVLSYPTVPEPGAVTLRWPHVRQALDRHDPERFLAQDQTADAFVHTSVTVDDNTWNGLSFVAPTVMEWSLVLPANGPRFRAHVGLEAAPVDTPASDGAAMTLTVVSEGAETLVDRHAVDAVGAPTAWEADLSRWAGREVTLKLASESGADTTFDWLYVSGPVVSGEPEHDARRVVIVALDTTRPDHISFFGYDRPTTPELDKVLGSSVVFDRAWSTAPRTRPSFRSSTTGRLPLEAVGATNIGDVFRQNGFVTAGIVANVHLQPRFDFDDGFDSWAFDGKANARQQVDRGLEWLKAHQTDDAYLFLHFMDPHMAYDAPPAFRNKFVPDPKLPKKVTRAEVMTWIAKGTITQAQREELEGLHDGEMSFLSVELGRFFRELDALPGRTMVVIHSDHGEEFWEHGGFEHNHSLYDELVRTVLAFRPNGGAKPAARLPEPATLMDIAPTLYDAFGFSGAPTVDGRSLLPVMGGDAAPERALPVGYLQYAHERWAVVYQNQKYILHTGSGQEELYDIASDPTESRDRSAGTDLTTWRQRLADVHTGLTVGPGYRIAVSATLGDAPVTFSLPAKAKRADVLDPETIVEHRANIEWGEVPRKSVADVGTVELAADGRSMTWRPGRKPTGVLYVVFDTPTPAAGLKATTAGAEVPVVPLAAVGPCDRFCVVAGTVVVPPVSEAVRIAQAKGGGDDLEMLCKLGYVTEGCDAADVAPEAGNEPGSDDEHGHQD